MSIRRRAPRAAKEVGRALATSVGQWTSSARMTPDFLIVGAQRCGTTSLFRLLAAHPNVVPPLFHKGVHYFDTANRYAKGIDWYRGHFPLRLAAARRGGPAVRTGEASPYYCFHPIAAERIAQDLPDVRLIMMVRNPVDRAFSAYKQERSRGFESESFERALELEPIRLRSEVERMTQDSTYQSFAHQHHAYVGRGEYALQIERLFSAVGRERVLVVDADDFFGRPRQLLPNLLAYLGLPEWQPDHIEHANARPSEAMPTQVRERLTEDFRVSDERLSRVLGRTPSWRN